jgi:alpha-glucosidase (family GH31 glycosyl hydrolase)
MPAPPASTLPKSRPAKPKAPEIPARTTLDGYWKFNRDESDDTRTKIQDSRGVDANPGGNRRVGVGYPGGGNPGGYPNDGGGGPYGRSGRQTENDEKLENLIRPPVSLTFALKPSTVELTDDHYHKMVFVTDGRPLQKSKEDNYQEVAAHWSGSQLVTDEKTPQGAKLSRTFELSFDGRQFVETVRVDRGKSKGTLLIRYVFDVAALSTQTDREADPDQPVMKRHPDSTDTTSPPPSGKPAPPPDPDQPVLRKKSADGGASPQ